MPQADTQVVIGDTMGELMLLYGASDIAFVGGSLIERGGHNMIEPAAWGRPIISGPHTFNFNEIARELVAAGGMNIVADGEQLMQALDELLADSQKRKAIGHAALNYVEKNRGAIDRLLTLVRRYTVR